MKKMKKIMALVIAMVMVLAMSITSMAAANTITVKNAKEGETYTIYKMLDLSVNTSLNAYRYTLNDTWEEFWTTGAGAEYVEVNEANEVVWKENKKSAEDMEAFGKAAAAWAEGKSIAVKAITVAEKANTAEFTELDNGYYMITSTYGTAVTIGSTPAKPVQEIIEKNTENTTEKEVLEAAERNESGNQYRSQNDAQIGDTVAFRSKIIIVKNTINVAYHDVMTDGLTLDPESIKVYTDVNLTQEFDASNYTVNTEVEDETFVVSFDDNYVTSLTNDTTLYIAYTAVLNNKAETTGSQTNTPSVTWGDNGSSTNEPTNTYTREFKILKYDGADNEKNPLAGAEFELYTSTDSNATPIGLAVNAEGTVYRVVENGTEIPTGYTKTDVIVTLSTGVITIKGVDSDDYYLVEITAPEGYNMLQDPVKVEVSETNELEAEIANNSGTLLPGTGGIGTTMFYVIGGVLVLAAMALVALKSRMKTED